MRLRFHQPVSLPCFRETHLTAKGSWSNMSAHSIELMQGATLCPGAIFVAGSAGKYAWQSGTSRALLIVVFRLVSNEEEIGSASRQELELRSVLQ